MATTYEKISEIPSEATSMADDDLMEMERSSDGLSQKIKKTNLILTLQNSLDVNSEASLVIIELFEELQLEIAKLKLAFEIMYEEKIESIVSDDDVERINYYED